jgi:hypothetical protein
MKIIIGLCGRAGSGKDTFANAVEGDKEVLAFVKPLKDAAAALFALSHEQLYDPLLKEVVVDDWGKSPREILQWMGTDIIRNQLDASFFIKHMQRRINQSTKNLIIVTDVRFANEAMLIKSLGGIIIHISRNSANTPITHASEQPIPIELIDSVVFNNDTKEEFEECVMPSVTSAWANHALKMKGLVFDQ